MSSSPREECVARLRNISQQLNQLQGWVLEVDDIEPGIRQELSTAFGRAQEHVDLAWEALDGGKLALFKVRVKENESVLRALFALVLKVMSGLR